MPRNSKRLRCPRCWKVVGLLQTKRPFCLNHYRCPGCGQVWVMSNGGLVLCWYPAEHTWLEKSPVRGSER